MDPNIYLTFAKHTLGDLAERRTHAGQKMARGERRYEVVNGVKQRVPLLGKRVCYQEGESTQVQLRGTDSTVRLTMAVMACERYGHVTRGVTFTHKAACRKVAEIILESDAPIGELFLKGTRGPKSRARTHRDQSRAKVASKTKPSPAGEKRASIFNELDALMAAEKTYEPDPAEPLQEVERLTRIIRSQVGEFIKNNPNVAQQFEAWFGAYRFAEKRDREWRNEVEAGYRRRVKATAETMGTTDQWTAMATSNLACLLHDQGKHAEATTTYKRAIKQWKGATNVNPKRRNEAIAMLEEKLANIKSVLE